jgi:hypothetical protein
MRNLNTYENWLLLEANKTVEYFKAHPELLSHFRTGDEKFGSKMDTWDPKQRRIIQVDKDYEVTDKINRQAADKFKKAGFSVKLTWPDRKHPREQDFAEWITNTEKNYDNSYEYLNFLEIASSSRSADDFEKNLESKITKPEYYKGSWKDFSFWPLIEKNWKDFNNICKWTVTALQGAKNASSKHYDNELMKLGLSKKDVEVAMTFVQEWTSMSRKKLDPSAWPILKKISVQPSSLPKYVYRGIFYDGAKIKDQKKFIEQWAPGMKPGASQGKATSWSVDRGTAASFMTDQDFIKDRKGGYFVLLKLEVDPNMVICDLRNLPVDHMFWNQQEIIIDPAAKNYEVDTIIPGAEEETYREFSRSIKGGQSAMGTHKKDFITRSFLKIPYDTINVLDRITWKELCFMSLKEVNTKYGTDFFTGAIKNDSKFGDIAFPIAIWMDRYGIAPAYKFTVNSPNEVTIKLGFTLDQLSWSSKNAEISQMIKDKGKEDPNFNYFRSTLAIIGDMTIKLVNSNYFNMDFEITLPSKMELMENPFNEPGKQYSDKDKESNKVGNEFFKVLYDKFGEKTFKDMLTQEASKLVVPRNIQYTIK